MTGNKIIQLYNRITEKLENLNDILLFAIRIVLAYGFYITASMKWQNISGVAEWFGELGIPFPTINAYLAATTEAVGVVLLILGLATRIISIPLIVTMIVAIVTVHWQNGFEAGNNGFEIPLYYLLFLFILLIKSSGKYSLDYLLKKKLNSHK
ncbi:MAG: DoxX family protein [Ignavibacteriaceae bacterium]|jgi:putative oxidoreductase|nr:DoxX family protein [Ignavibacteriaceae bacterium]